MGFDSLRPRFGVMILCLAVHIYLTLRVALSRFDWPDLPGNYATHAAVMATFTFLHAWRYLGGSIAARFFATALIVSWLFEQVGVATGAVYGPYHYTASLGPKLGHVPLAIPIAWSMMLYVCWSVTQLLVPASSERPALGAAVTAIIGALIVTGWDAAIDPYFSVVGPELRWIWHGGGDYFGVPFANFRGWFATGITAFVLFALVTRGARFRDERATLAPAIIFALFALATICTTEPLPLRITALCSMGLVAVLCFARLLVPERQAS